jgi:hypothetical protein
MAVSHIAHALGSLEPTQATRTLRARLNNAA